MEKNICYKCALISNKVHNDWISGCMFTSNMVKCDNCLEYKTSSSFSYPKQLTINDI